MIIRLENSIFEANQELIQIKNVLISRFNEIFQNSQPLKLEENLKRFYVMKRKLNSIWHLVMNLDNSPSEFVNRPLKLKKMMQVLFNEYFNSLNCKVENLLVDNRNENLIKLASQLEELKVFDSYEDTFVSVLLLNIRKYIEENCAGIFYEDRLSMVKEWLNSVCFVWLDSLFEPILLSEIEDDFYYEKEYYHSDESSSDDLDQYKNILIETTPFKDKKKFEKIDQLKNPKLKEMETKYSKLSNWKSRLDYFVLETFAKFRIDEMFDIIVDFPNSLPAVKDLKTCLDITKQYPLLVSTLQSTFKKRLLHSGANTTDILSAYISTMKVFLELDNSSVLLNYVSNDIRTYLRNRHDSLRAVISLLIEDSGQGSILLQELIGSETKQYYDEENEEIFDDNDNSWLKWKPKPVIKNPGNSFDYLSSRISMDTISYLVTIFGNKQVFLEGYSQILSERLLNISNFNVDDDIRNLELLKIKFGEVSMQQSEIMLKDMSDSKRNNAYINNEINKELTSFPISITIVSYMFWPSLNKFKFLLPPRIEEYRNRFEEIYSNLKASRNLQWYDMIGFVDLEIEIDDHKINFQVTQLQASVILLFENKNCLKIDQIVDSIKSNLELVKKALQFWISNGIITETSQLTYQVCDNIETNNTTQIEDSPDPKILEKQDDSQSITPFILAMLKNLGCLQLPRIHKMMSNVNPDYKKTIQELNQLMEQLVKNDSVELISTGYILKKK